MPIISNKINVLQLIKEHVRKDPEADAVIYVRPGDEPFRWKWFHLWKTASFYAKMLQENGIQAGEVCAIIMRHEPHFVPIYLGIAMTGALPAVLAYPNPRLHPEKFRHGLIGMSRKSGLDWVLIEKELESNILPLFGSSSSIKGFHMPLEWSKDFITHSHEEENLPGLNVDSESPFLLQHSSGTTGLQKGVVLSNKAVITQIKKYADAIQLDKKDIVVSWLPLYHDMGLIAAFLMPLIQGIPQHIISPFDWVTAPVLFLQTVSECGGTLSWLPNFSYNHMATRIDDLDLEGIRLDSIRLLVNCSEPVRKHSHQLFQERFAPYGLNPNTLGASYALAENTFAVTQTHHGMAASSILVHRDSLLRGKVRLTTDETEGRWCVSSGKLIEGSECRFLAENGEDAPSEEVGEITIRSPYMFSGYRNDHEATEASMRDGWFMTGDMGFIHEGEIYVVGRKKDLIIVAGKNIYPEDVEDIVSGIRGVLPGRVVAFGIENPELGTEGIHVIAETKIPDHKEQQILGKIIVNELMAWDISIKKVHFVPPRWLIKSSAGKLSRKLNMERVLEGGPGSSSPREQ